MERKTPDPIRSDRRRFCAGLAVIGASACSPMPSNQIRVGGIDGGTAEGPGGDDGGSGNEDLASDDLAHAGNEDLAHSGNPDMAHASNPDMAMAGPSCSGTVSGGAASAITASSPKYISSKGIFVCRDSGGIYAMSAKCTHSGCTLTHETTQFYCNCHGATFDLNGQNPTSPAYSPLKHYATCIDSSGNVQVNTGMTVSASTRT